MKNITLLFIVFILTIGAYAQDNYDCSKEFMDGGGNAWGELHKYIFASDFIVEENETFNLTSLQFNAITTPDVPIDGVSIYFYEDTGGNGPGTELGMQEISEIEVTLLGDYATDFDRNTIALELNEPFEFEGDENATTTYWIGILLDFDDEATSFIEVTEDFDTENATYFFDEEAQVWVDGEDPMWPIGGFEHAMIALYGSCSPIFKLKYLHPYSYDAMIALYGSCSPMGVEDFAIESFTHFIQNGQMTVESAEQIQEVAIYNLLGQEVIAEIINATSGNINLGSLNAGVYLTKVNVDGNTKTFKFSVN